MMKLERLRSAINTVGNCIACNLGILIHTLKAGKTVYIALSVAGMVALIILYKVLDSRYNYLYLYELTKGGSDDEFRDAV